MSAQLRKFHKELGGTGPRSSVIYLWFRSNEVRDLITLGMSGQADLLMLTLAEECVCTNHRPAAWSLSWRK